MAVCERKEIILRIKLQLFERCATSRKTRLSAIASEMITRNAAPMSGHRISLELPNNEIKTEHGYKIKSE